MTAALDLIAVHGVSGTSLQMIADAVGVTKAAIYYRFKTKDEIVIAVTEMQLGKLEGALEAAVASNDPSRVARPLTALRDGRALVGGAAGDRGSSRCPDGRPPRPGWR